VYAGGERVEDVERRGVYETVVEALGDVVFDDILRFDSYEIGIFSS
jgi:hypothetical protein